MRIRERTHAMWVTIRGLPHCLRAKFIALRDHEVRWLHDGHRYAHLAYFGAVFVEGHGIYATMGGVLLVTGLLMIIITGAIDD